MNLKQAAQACREGLELNEVQDLVEELLHPETADTEREEFLRAFALKGETPEELARFANAFLPYSLELEFNSQWRGRPILDCCGTGGGGLDILNISTATMFLLAAARIPVAKHGNRGVTKKSGSADVLEALGIRVDWRAEDAVCCLEEIGMVFLFAPSYHPAFKVVAPVRKKLAGEGVRTMFNLLGPLLNPCRPAAQLVGVFKESHLALFRKALMEMNCRRAIVAWGRTEEGVAMGEVSPSGPTLFEGCLDGEVVWWTDSGVPKIGSLDELKVNDAQESARLIEALFEGKVGGIARMALIYNAAVGMFASGMCQSVYEARDFAKELLDSGKALEKLEQWREFSLSIQKG